MTVYDIVLKVNALVGSGIVIDTIDENSKSYEEEATISPPNLKGEVAIRFKYDMKLPVDTLEWSSDN